MPEDLHPSMHDKLNAETGRIGWPELQRHFARGVVIRVDGALDLVQVACAFVEDDRPAVEGWLKDGQVAKASLEEARRWEEARTEFWAVVAAPWVLAQEIERYQ